jgi:hypothetical protein
VLYNVKYQVDVGVGAATVVLGTSPGIVDVVTVQLAHERLAPQGSWGIEQMEVVKVDRHELLPDVMIGRVVAEAIGGVVRVGRFDAGLSELVVEAVGVSSVVPDGKTDIGAVEEASCSVTSSIVSILGSLWCLGK